MNRDAHERAFARNQLAQQQGPRIEFAYPLSPLPSTEDGSVSAGALIRRILEGIDKATSIAPAERPYVVVVRIDPERGLVFSLVDVALPPPSSAGVIFAPSSEMEGAPGEAKASTEGPDAKVDGIAGQEPQPIVSQPLSIHDPRAHQEVPVKPPITQPLELAGYVPSPVKETQDLWVANQILTRVKSGELLYLDDIEAEIQRLGSNHRLVRDTLINALPDWPDLLIEKTVVPWTGLKGLVEPLQMRNHLLIEGVIRGVTSDKSGGEVRLDGVTVITKEHATAVAENTLSSTQCVKISYEASDRGTRLSLQHAFGKKVRLAATVSRCLKIGSPWILKVLDSFPVEMSAFELKLHQRRLQAELERKPPTNDDFWTQTLKESKA